MIRPIITDFMGDGFNVAKITEHYLENLELMNYIVQLDEHVNDLETEILELTVTLENTKKANAATTSSSNAFICPQCGGLFTTPQTFGSSFCCRACENGY